MQALAELCYKSGLLLVRHAVQLSDVSKPIRTKIRTQFRGSGTIHRSDMPGLPYVPPRSSVATQLAIAAPERWPELATVAAGGSNGGGPADGAPPPPSCPASAAWL